MDKHPDDLLTGDGDPFKGDPNFMASLARGLEVIQAFTPQRPLLSISQISQKTGIPRAAVRRCLYTLSKLGFVYAEDGKNFQLRRGSWRWATPGWPRRRWRVRRSRCCGI